MSNTKMFVHYKGTVADFKQLSNISDYDNKIVFIKGGTDGKGAAIYTHGSYFANFAEFLAAINYVKGVNVGGQNYNAAAGGGYVAFNASDPATVAINAGSDGISIGLTEAFVNRVSAVENLAGSTSTDLGAKGDAADATGSAFARIAQLAAAVAGLQGSGSGSVADQITAAVNALKGTLAEDDALTLEAINDELDALSAKCAGLETEVSKNAGTNVKVTVKTKDGVVSGVDVDESGLTAALNLKADASAVYTKSEADAMAQGKVDTLANGAVKDNTEAIAILNGNTSVDGSVEKKIQDAINAFAGSADNDNVIENVTELLAYVSKVDGGKDLSVAIADIAANKAAIGTLNGDDKTSGSVAKAIADEVTRADGAYAVKGTESVAAGAASRAEEAYTLAGQKATAAEAKAQAQTAISEIAEVTKADSDNAYVKVTVKTKSGSVSSVEVDDSGVKSYADSLATNYDAAGSAAAAQSAAQAYADSLFAWEEL